jgi:S-formylglutathione hydrolase FrmB
VFGYPLESIKDIPPGEYFVQGVVNVYTEFKRSDGHTVWMHNDQWEGQRWTRSPGNIISDVVKVKIDPSEAKTVTLSCNDVIPPIKVPEDTTWVKRIKFQSEILTHFWGQPIYLGATILLPKGYDEHPGVKYPVNYIQGHFSLRSPNGFNLTGSGQDDARRRRGSEFSKYWMSENCPRMIFVTFQHPCPYYDDSYAVNSENCGPYGDAILQELIPYVEEHFRIIRKPYARVLSGGSTGGWESLALQIFHPDFFGGTWSLCPDPVDFRYFQTIDIYKDKNAYYKEIGWLKVPTSSDRSINGISRLTIKQRNHMELAMGTKNRSGQQIDIFEAVYGPVGSDGYVKSLLDKRTGEIDPSVAEYWKENYDLRHILQRDWVTLGPKLKGKLHIYVGDMDTFYLDNAVRLLERFLERTENPYYDGVVEYGDRKPHCWGPRGADLINLMAEHIIKNAPSGEDTTFWRYK